MKDWLEHMHKTYGQYLRVRSEDWLVGGVLIFLTLLLSAPLYALARAWWRLWVG